eukprot:COSAG05_NODE_6944_length_876_cov_16.747692_1_plen_116_part_10
MDFDVLQGEIVTMLAVLRGNSRFHLHGLYGDHALVHGLKQLAAEIAGLPLLPLPWSRVDAHAAFKPFLQVLRPLLPYHQCQVLYRKYYLPGRVRARSAWLSKRALCLLLVLCRYR